MNIIGKWKVKELLFPTPNGMASYTPENLPVGDHADEIIMLLMSITQFTEDGLMKTLMRVPEDKIELAKSQGAVIDEDGFAAIEQTTWKETVSFTTIPKSKARSSERRSTRSPKYLWMRTAV